MVEKNEILKLAQELSLNPNTVEKDYVLGWMLDGIFNHNALGKNWLFKGGTSLKKCFFETYRFSEDLDFTVTEESHLNIDFLKASLHEIADYLQEKVGIKFNKDNFKYKVLPKENGKVSSQCVVSYVGPLGQPNGATIYFDLTTDELVVLGPEKKKVHHPYTDEPSEFIWANCYTFEEVIAEKVRALGQRARPRDLYDVVHFFRNREMIKNPQLVNNVLLKKCGYKNMAVPTFQGIETHEKIGELEGQWSNMLAHQLPNLPPMESFWADLNPFFEWLAGSLEVQKLNPVSKADDVVFQPGRIANAFAPDAILQRIQFAAANRVCITLSYHGKERTVEPLSFRRASNGNRLFYGYERDADQVKAYSLLKIQDIQITNTPYTEREHPVEISPSGTISMPPLKRASSGRRSVGLASGPQYIYECLRCGRELPKRTRNSALRPHMDEYGSPCPGRIGRYVDTRY